MSADKRLKTPLTEEEAAYAFYMLHCARIIVWNNEISYYNKIDYSGSEMFVNVTMGDKTIELNEEKAADFMELVSDTRDDFGEYAATGYVKIGAAEDHGERVLEFEIRNSAKKDSSVGYTLYEDGTVECKHTITVFDQVDVGVGEPELIDCLYVNYYVMSAVKFDVNAVRELVNSLK